MEEIETRNTIKNLLFPVNQYPIGQVKNPELKKDKSDLEAGSKETFVTRKDAVHIAQFKKMYMQNMSDLLHILLTYMTELECT